MRAAHRLGLAFAALAALVSGGCGPLQACPEGWDEESTRDGIGRCVPPDGYADEVRARIGTGLYGWATRVRAEKQDDELATCSNEDIRLASSSMHFTLRDPSEPPQYSVAVDVRDDGTWETRVEPGKMYVARSEQAGFLPSQERFFSLRSAQGDMTIPFGDQIELEQGQVSLVEARLLTCIR